MTFFLEGAICMALSAAHEYAKSYSSYSGADIVASINKKVFGEIQGITYSVSRAKVPIYTMGSAEPRSFSRGNRGIAGTLVFSTFDRDALIAAFKEEMKDTSTLGIQKYVMNDPSEVKTAGNSTGFTSIETWDNEMSQLIKNATTTPTTLNNTLVKTAVPYYADELLPFDITLTFANEYGNCSIMVIYGVEIMNEGSGFSTDTMVAEKAYTYMARRIEPMRSLESDSSISFASSW